MLQVLFLVLADESDDEARPRRRRKRTLRRLSPRAQRTSMVPTPSPLPPVAQRVCAQRVCGRHKMQNTCPVRVRVTASLFSPPRRAQHGRKKSDREAESAEKIAVRAQKLAKYQKLSGEVLRRVRRFSFWSQATAAAAVGGCKPPATQLTPCHTRVRSGANMSWTRCRSV